MAGHTIFVLYLERIAAIAMPLSRRSKAQLYAVKAELAKEKPFRGRALLHRVIDQLSDYL